MKEKEISKILLIRSVEESESSTFTSEALLEASIVSGKAENDIALIQSRADYLYHKLPDTLKKIPDTLHLPRKWIGILCIGVFVLGIGFNYLGPSDMVHVIYNPVILLILWNIGVFALFLIRHFFMKKEKAHDTEIWHHTLELGYTSSLYGRVLRKIWFSFHQYLAKKKQQIKKFSSSLKIINRYMELWWAIHQHVFMSRCTRLIHLLAVSLIMGALAGIYIRGLFFEYNVIWKSTFIHDTSNIALILNIIFGLPSQLLYGDFIQVSNISSLIRPHGAPAAPWIHLFSLCAFMYVIPERFFLALLESRRLKVLSEQITIHPGEHYYARCITLAREMQANRLQKDISNVVQAEVERLSESIALYARDRFYDDKVVPQLVHFRDNGGRIRDLEDAISQQSEGFKVELISFLETVQEDFKQSLAERISEVIGENLSPIEVTVEHGMDIHTSAYRKALDETVTAKMTRGISAAVTAAVAATVGTLSGGFGKVLGIAVISTLLHTTGPIGFIIGALAGLLLGGGASILAKDKITDVVKNQKFPAFSTQFILRESKMNQTVEEGREQVYTLIRTQISDKLALHIDEITNQIISKIAPVLKNGKDI